MTRTSPPATDRHAPHVALARDRGRSTRLSLVSGTTGPFRPGAALRGNGYPLAPLDIAGTADPSEPLDDGSHDDQESPRGGRLAAADSDRGSAGGSPGRGKRPVRSRHQRDRSARLCEQLAPGSGVPRPRHMLPATRNARGLSRPGARHGRGTDVPLRPARRMRTRKVDSRLESGRLLGGWRCPSGDRRSRYPASRRCAAIRSTRPSGRFA